MPDSLLVIFTQSRRIQVYGRESFVQGVGKSDLGRISNPLVGRPNPFPVTAEANEVKWENDAVN